ncbi:maleylpyruvate isomerase family mycothiol-dependent enzyme [Nonomuraea sp. bgisy101]|uniref:maleylpyruvate isomerase family mycothiol-dependent enzyme n=1 Tax=Nonomuraea sp. bgisy101 TaxID=3413784 RepID=UPI003D70EEDC
MDHLPHFRREILAFETAARKAAEAGTAPIVPSCPEWSVSDLVGHLGWVHRFVAHIITERLQEPPQALDPELLDLPPDLRGWQGPGQEPTPGPVPRSLIEWFGSGAFALESAFRKTGQDERVWTWSRDRTTGFWLRMQTIEAAVHRWDAEGAVGTAQPVEADLAADAVVQSLTVMAPYRRTVKQAPPGSGERFRFRQIDGAGDWTVAFNGDDVLLIEGGEPGDVELTGTASDLMLFLWQRIPPERLEVKGEREVLDRYFTLVPPV